MQTYQEQFNRLTEAYIKLEVNPFSACNCFVGNLLNNNTMWSNFRSYSALVSSDRPVESCKLVSGWGNKYEYSLDEVISLERCFLLTYIGNNYNQLNAFITDECDFETEIYGEDPITYEEYLVIQEEALFKAFEDTLDVLKEIHTKRGENVEFIPFKKRELV